MLYGLSHVDLRAVPTGLVVGLFAAWLRGRSGSIVPAVLASVAINGLPLVPILIGREELELGGRLAAGGAIGAGVCAWGIAWILARDGRAENARLMDA
jgi:membrane protease YdiL (CAAX protease family)